MKGKGRSTHTHIQKRLISGVLQTCWDKRGPAIYIMEESERIYLSCMITSIVHVLPNTPDGPQNDRSIWPISLAYFFLHTHTHTRIYCGGVDGIGGWWAIGLLFATNFSVHLILLWGNGGCNFGNKMLMLVSNFLNCLSRSSAIIICRIYTLFYWWVFNFSIHIALCFLITILLM